MLSFFTFVFGTGLNLRRESGKAITSLSRRNSNSGNRRCHRSPSRVISISNHNINININSSISISSIDIKKENPNYNQLTHNV